MTFQRISALAELISRYKEHQKPEDEVVVIVSFDNLAEMRAKCTWQLMFTKDYEDYFMGCKVIMSRSNNYLAVAYLDELEDKYHDIIEITDEEADNDK